METKIKLSFLLLLLLSVSFSTYPQSKDNIKVLKRYSLYKCLTNNYYQIDSSFVSHDYTASYIFQIKSVDYELLGQIDRYVEKNTSNYYKNGIIENLEDRKANYICWYCFDFYESKELDRFVKKILNK